MCLCVPALCLPSAIKLIFFAGKPRDYCLPHGLARGKKSCRWDLRTLQLENDQDMMSTTRYSAFYNPKPSFLNEYLGFLNEPLKLDYCKSPRSPAVWLVAWTSLIRSSVPVSDSGSNLIVWRCRVGLLLQTLSQRGWLTFSFGHVVPNHLSMLFISDVAAAWSSKWHCCGF